MIYSQKGYTNGIELDIANTQGRIYRMMAREGYDMEVFSREFLRSDFCRREFDVSYSRFQINDEEESADFFLPEIGDRLVKYENGVVFDTEIADWIGWSYRYLVSEIDISSSELEKAIPFQEMYGLWISFHTVDDSYLVDQVCEWFSLKRRAENLYAIEMDE